MLPIIRSMSITVLLAATIILSGCGGSSTATEFDSQELNDNSAQIQTNANNAGLVFAGTITSIGTAPAFWSGIAMSTQAVTYDVNRVLKGAYSESSITVYHVLVDGTRQAASAPGLSDSIFIVGGEQIVFASENADYVSLGDTWNVPYYIDVDPDYGTIPYSSDNEDVVESMIANPTTSQAAQTLEKVVPVAKTLTINGAEADVTSFNNLLDQCKEQSSTLNGLVSQISNSDTWTVTLNIVRNEDNIFVDSFTGRKVDIHDLESWHEGCNSKTDLCQLFGHFLQEYWHAAVTGDGYEPSHESALQTENQIRSDLGKTTTLEGHVGVEQDGTWYMQTAYNGYVELVKLDGANPGEVTVEISPPAAPTGLTADDGTSCRITISWTDNAGDEGGYSIERKDGASGSWAVIYGVGADTTSWVNTPADYPMTLGETYCYRVRAWKTVDSETVYSAYSNEACGVKQ